jgi:LuxR family transcriptional regulator, maltose regulon positive regulatory protein
VRHAAQAGDWPLAASMVIDGLAIGEIIEPSAGPSLAGEFGGMPPGHAWTEPAPHLVSAAVALSAGRHQASIAALDAAEGLLERLPADQEAAGRLAAAMIRLAVSRRTGDLATAVAAADRAEALVGQVPGAGAARHRKVRARVLSGCGAVKLWSGHHDEAARILESGAAAAAASGGAGERADCLGQLALVEALRGRLGHAATVAAQATAADTIGEQPPAPHPSALVALAWVHLEHHELREARSRLTQADAALGVAPDKLIGAVAALAAAYGALAGPRAAVAAQIVARARSGWSVPAWLGQRLSQAESRAHAAAGDIPAALAAAGRAGHETSLEAAVTLARAWVAAGDGESATRALVPVLATGSGAHQRVRLQAWLVDAQLGYHRGDRARGHSSLASALRLAEPEQLRLPFVIERSWIGPVLRSDPELARAHRRLLTPLAPVLGHDQLPAAPGVPDQAPILAAEPLTEREREVLRHASSLLSTAEIASEMYISVNTVKSHLAHIYSKLAATHRGEAVRRARQLELI